MKKVLFTSAPDYVVRTERILFSIRLAVLRLRSMVRINLIRIQDAYLLDNIKM